MLGCALGCLRFRALENLIDLVEVGGEHLELVFSINSPSAFVAGVDFLIFSFFGDLFF